MSGVSLESPVYVYSLMASSALLSFMMLTASQRTLQLSSKEEVLEVVADEVGGDAGPVPAAEGPGLWSVEMQLEGPVYLSWITAGLVSEVPLVETQREVGVVPLHVGQD